MKQTYIKPTIETVRIQPVSLLEESLGKGSSTLSGEQKGLIQSIREDYGPVEE